MPRPRKWPPTVHHDTTHDTDYIKFTLNGVRQTVSLGRHGTPEARQKYLHIVAELEAGRTPAKAGVTRGPGSGTVAHLILAYLPHAESRYNRYAEGKVSGQMRKVDQALGELHRLYGSTRVSDFGPKSLKVLRERFMQLGWSRGYIGSCVGVVVRLFKWGVSEELVPVDIWQALTSLPPLARDTPGVPEPKEVEPVEDWVVEATLPHLNPVVADMVRLQRLTGMRGGEVRWMRPADIDREGRVHGFGQFPGLWVYEPERHKTRSRGKRRIIFLGVQAQALLAPHLARLAERPEAYLFSPATASEWHYARMRAGRKTKRWPSHDPELRRMRRGGRRAGGKRPPGERYNADSYSRAVARGADQANAAAIAKKAEETGQPPEAIGRLIESWSPHRLRHALGTAVVGPDGDLESAGAVLGHASMAATQRYAKLLAKAAAVMGKIG